MSELRDADRGPGPAATSEQGAVFINEIFLSLQGESAYVGLPCIFVRFTACPLRCSYCDTAYAFTEGQRSTVGAVLERIHELAAPFASLPASPRLPLVEITGGEPLIQENAPVLMRTLCRQGFRVLLETSGTIDLAPVDPCVHVVMDLKCPSSGEGQKNHWDNLWHLKSTDEIKFVIASQQDYEWARDTIRRHDLPSICQVLFAWASPLTPEQQHPTLKKLTGRHILLTRQELAECILTDALPVRFQTQLHKIIWPPAQRGV